MIRKGSLVCYTGVSKGLINGKLYSVHDVNEGTAWLWVHNENNWSKKRVPLDEIKLVVE